MIKIAAIFFGKRRADNWPTMSQIEKSPSKSTARSSASRNGNKEDSIERASREVERLSISLKNAVKHESQMTQQSEAKFKQLEKITTDLIKQFDGFEQALEQVNRLMDEMKQNVSQTNQELADCTSAHAQENETFAEIMARMNSITQAIDDESELGSGDNDDKYNIN